MNTWLIILSIAASYLVLNESNRLAVLVLCFLTLFFNMIGSLIPAGYMVFYYVGAMLNDLLIIYALSMISKQTKLIELLIRINIGFIFVNLIAFGLYMLYVSYVEFTLMYTVMYIGILLTIITNGDRYVLGSDSVGSGYFGVSSGNRSGAYIIPKNKAETRN